MNFGVYLPSLANTDLLGDVVEGINYGLDCGKLNDASIFYDNIAHVPFSVDCGIFHSTDIWNFNGVLVTVSLPTTLTALKIVNNIELYYYYGIENNVNVLHLINLLKNKLHPICSNEDNKNDMFRKTGVIPKFTVRNFKQLIQRLDK